MNVSDTTEPIDHTAVNWSGVVAVRYRIEQTLRYEYERPIRNLHHQLIIAPRARHLDQERIDHRLWTTHDAPLCHTTDDFGNDVASISIARVEREISFCLESTIARAAPLDAFGQRRHEAIDPRWLDVSRLTRCDEALRDCAAELRMRYPEPLDRMQAIVAFVHASMTYTKGVTDVFTTAATALRMGRGVCQDYSHIAIALARACGIGARYASGHLIGEGATHAWVEFLVPQGDAWTVYSLDPTYNSATDFRYVVVAIGRDYNDVPPTSGSFSGRSAGTLNGRQHVALTQLTYAA